LSRGPRASFVNEGSHRGGGREGVGAYALRRERRKGEGGENANSSERKKRGAPGLTSAAMRGGPRLIITTKARRRGDYFPFLGRREMGLMTNLSPNTWPGGKGEGGGKSSSSNSISQKNSLQLRRWEGGFFPSLL